MICVVKSPYLKEKLGLFLKNELPSYLLSFATTLTTSRLIFYCTINISDITLQIFL